MWTAETVLVCALTLLHRSAQSFPPIELVSMRPAHASANVEGYVPVGENRIYLVTTTSAFDRARRSVHRCGELQAIRKIASVLVHEEWHVRHGSDEAGAYVAQLATLVYLDAGPGNPLYVEVTRSMRSAIRGSRSPRPRRRLTGSSPAPRSRSRSPDPGAATSADGCSRY